MQKRSITTPLSLAFAFVLLLLAAIGAVGLSNLKIIDNHLGLISDELLKKYTLMTDMRQAARERSLSLHRMIMLVDPFERDEEWLVFNQYGAAFARAREELEAMALSVDELEHMERRAELIRKNVVVQLEVAAFAMDDMTEQATSLLISQAVPAQNEVLSHIESQLELYTSWLNEERMEAGKTYQRLRTFGLIAGILAILGGLWVAIWSVRQIDRDQRALLAREREQGDIIDGMMTGVITINERGIIENFNRAAMEIFGYRAEEVVGNNINMLLPETAHARHDGYLEQYFINEDINAFMGERELYACRADGSTFPLSIMLSKIPPREDGTKRVIASCFDITEQKEQEQRLRSSQKMDALGKLTGGIAHDYNNMLAVILGYAELLKLRLAKDDTQLSYVDEIHQAAERGSRLTSKLLAFTRRKPMEESAVDVNELLRDDRMMLEKTLTVAVTLRLQLDDKLCVASLDRDDLENAILNIAINARHAMPEGGVLTIETRRIELLPLQAKRHDVVPGEYVSLSITDTGTGMDEETMSRIFEPFFSTKGENGTGLGMSQVYGFVQRSGGDISVDSTPGEGTRFELLFPCIDSSQREITPTGEGGVDYDAPADKTILVVDDEPAMCSMISEMLQVDGYHVLMAHGAEEALNLLRKEPIDLMLSDVIMPGMNGYQLAAEVQLNHPDVAIQMMSGYSDNIDSSQVEPQLATHMLSKPFSAEVLRERVAQLFT